MKSKSNRNDMIFYFLTKVFSGILSFALISIFTYYLRPELYGEYSLIQGLINVFTSIFIGWISSSSLRYYSDYKQDKEKFYTNIFADWIFSIFIVIIIILILSKFSININIKGYLYLIILLFICNSTIELLNSIVRADKNTKKYFLSVLIQYIINILAFIIMFKKFKMDIVAVFSSYIISYLIIIIYLIAYYKIFKHIKIDALSKEIQVKFLKYGLPMIGVWATNWLLNYSDRYIIKIFFSNAEVGYYDIAYKLSENSINVIITSISMASMPYIIDKYNSFGIEKATEYLNGIIQIYIALVVPAIFGLIGIRYSIYNSLISVQYIKGINIVIYISISMFFFGICQLFYKLWQLEEKTNRILKLMIFSAILNIILNIIFIPKFGFIVASETTLFANFVTFIIVFLMIKKEYNVSIEHKTLLKSICSSIVMYIFLVIFVNRKTNMLLLIVYILIAIIIYLSMLYCLNRKKINNTFFKKKLKITKKCQTKN